jgi:hypothetical protein
MNIRTALTIALLGLSGPGFARESESGREPLAPVNDPNSPAEVTANPMKAVDVRVHSRRRLMEVQVAMASGTGRDTPFEYSIRWFDVTGMLIPSFTGAWFAGDIPGSGTALIYEIAPSPEAVKLEIVCREVHHGGMAQARSQPLLLCFNSNSN